MSDLRFDPVNNQWVTIARNRGERPMEFVPLDHTRQQIICPFCKGNEDETPGTLVAYHPDGTELQPDDDPSNWTVRVIPNKYPSFQSTGGSVNGKTIAEPTWEGPYRTLDNPGEQELIISSPRHISSISELDDQELRVSFHAFQQRIKYQAELPHVRHAMLFMNCRMMAGASLTHIHSQLIGSPLVSDHLTRRGQRNEQHVEEFGKTLIRSLAEWEWEQQTRIVYRSDRFLVFCPYASRFPFQTWIVPQEPGAGFSECPEAARNELADLCRRTVVRLEYLHNKPGYNVLLHQSPFDQAATDHWYIEIFPRLTRVAGFEWGTDIWVNPVAPETAAKRIRVN
jgi:UDPglucose--hexose-1-phosphate uridylyltransferase